MFLYTFHVQTFILLADIVPAGAGLHGRGGRRRHRHSFLLPDAGAADAVGPGHRGVCQYAPTVRGVVSLAQGYWVSECVCVWLCV